MLITMSNSSNPKTESDQAHGDIIQGLNNEQYQQLMNLLSPHLYDSVKDSAP